MSAGWNLDDINISEFPIIQIRFISVPEIPGDEFSLSQLQKTIPIRLFILSHRITNFGIPSIFVESTPSYLISNQDLSKSISSDNIPSIIVFDLDNKFDDFIQNDDFPQWAETKKSIWSIQNPNHDKDIFLDLSEEFFDDLQQAITLKTYYQFYLFSPLYFTTYLLIPPQTDINDSYLKNKEVSPFKFNSILEPILIKPVPSFVFNCIKIRWIVESNLNCVVNPRYGAKVGSFILIPPFRHPLCISSITTEKTKIYKNTPISFNINEAKSPAIIPKINSKVIPLPITKGTINRPISPAIGNSISYTTETTITISAMTIDKEQSVTFKIIQNDDSTNLSIDYVLLMKPSIALYHFFHVKNFQYEYKRTPLQYSYPNKQPIPNNPQQAQSQNPQQTPQYCHFDDLDIFDVDDKEIENFFKQHFSEESAGQTNSVSDQQEIVFSFIEDTIPTPYQLITEQISDKIIKKRISKTIDSILLRFNPNVSVSEFFINPDNDTKSITIFTKRIDLELPKINYTYSKCISSFNFMSFHDFFGFSTSISPPIGQIFNFKEIPSFIHLGVPNILLSQDGTTKEVPADNFLPTWEREKLMPIYGPKNGHFVVFYETFSSKGNGGVSSSMMSFGFDGYGYGSNSISDTHMKYLQMMNNESIMTFMNRFCDSYTQLNFGEMNPYTKCNTCNPVKLQPLTKISTTTSTSKTNTTSNETTTTKIEIDVDSSSYECESMKRSVSVFLSSNPLIQFQECPIIAFIIGGPSCHFFTLESDRKSKGSSVILKESENYPHLHTVFVSPEMIISATSDQIRSLCFEVYGMIRKNQQISIGNFEFMHKSIKAEVLQNQLTQGIHKIQQVQSSQNPMQNQNQEIQIKQMKSQLKHLMFSNFFFKLFFGYRYQPPFVLNHTSEQSFLMTPESTGINLHIAWDRYSGISVWTNDTGDLLHTAKVRDFTDIMYMIKNVCSYSPRNHQQQMQQMQQMIPMVKKITLTLLEEYLGQSNYEKFMQILPQGVDLFTFYHAPSVKASFSEDFNDDVVIFENLEISNGLKMIQVGLPKPVQDPTQTSVDSTVNNNVSFVLDLPAKPESTCFVLSPNHQAYKMSVYKGGGQERLLDFVKKMSHLSWLSVQPGHENRTSSYPPHINVLIQQNKSSCSSISQFEFLPTK